MDLDVFLSFKDKIVSNVKKIIVGKDDIIELVTIAFICGGHILLEDIPGVGKTMLVKAFAKSIGREYKRIQFTPDLLPSDLTGINYYNQKSRDFEFRQGPLFSNLILADEINRATPRTQASLLEAMEESQISVDGVTRKLSEPFMVLATQNPIESFGTFPLPEAQLDRFFMRISMGYPERNEEISILRRQESAALLDDLPCILEETDLAYVLRNYRSVRASDDVVNYLMDIVEATRKNEKIQLGVSPRGSIALFKAAQARAAIHGRDYLIPEDIKEMARYVLNHRLIMKGGPRSKMIYEAVDLLLGTVKTPVENF
ncbi:MoxR family ATPase [Desulfosporosinus sp. PR]|uniref:AAA family ATPase n=1 Tax=Candidatus Desulfosporosinus nitrosoreducens TaxID=3401928 RepID=UPI0027F351DD|nr:MoxR family ATPase [Desulfosporosinus sp. PR]MDQ7096354.1 MoxR family ATPase [Desulfosporosinus sp. PR]